MTLVSEVGLRALRKRGCIIGPHLRCAFSIAIESLAMLYLGVLQLVIKANPIQGAKDEVHGDTLKSTVSIYYQLPPHFLIAWGLTLFVSSCLEYANTHTAKHIKTAVLSLYTVAVGMGSVLSLPISPLVTEDRIAYLFFGLSSLGSCITIIYYMQYRKYDIRDKELYLSSVAAKKASGRSGICK
eukprot:Nk52_evm45s2340 gene=Nk52_evmTU45s2340